MFEFPYMERVLNLDKIIRKLLNLELGFCLTVNARVPHDMVRLELCCEYSCPALSKAQSILFYSQQSPR